MNIWLFRLKTPSHFQSGYDFCIFMQCMLCGLWFSTLFSSSSFLSLWISWHYLVSLWLLWLPLFPATGWISLLGGPVGISDTKFGMPKLKPTWLWFAQTCSSLVFPCHLPSWQNPGHLLRPCYILIIPTTLHFFLWIQVTNLVSFPLLCKAVW